MIYFCNSGCWRATIVSVSVNFLRNPRSNFCLQEAEWADRTLPARLASNIRTNPNALPRRIHSQGELESFNPRYQRSHRIIVQCNFFIITILGTFRRLKQRSLRDMMEVVLGTSTFTVLISFVRWTFYLRPTLRCLPIMQHTPGSLHQ